MAKSLIEEEVEKILKKKKLKYDKISEGGFIQYSVFDVGEEFKIVVVNDFVSLKLSLLTEEDVKTMNNLLYRLGWTYKDLTYYKKKVDKLMLFTIDIFPFSYDSFRSTIEDIHSHFYYNVKKPYKTKQKTPKDNKDPTPKDNKDPTPKEFFLNEYKSFKLIDDSEKVNALELLLQVKEKYFRNFRTLKSIKGKLMTLKEEVFKDSSEVDLEEFILLDFAALLRVIELNLLELSLKDFFDNFKGEIRK
ncbi:MAG: hypothetical protein K6343_05850 [Caldisericaceae bacterium]